MSNSNDFYKNICSTITNTVCSGVLVSLQEKPRIQLNTFVDNKLFMKQKTKLQQEV